MTKEEWANKLIGKKIVSVDPQEDSVLIYLDNESVAQVEADVLRYGIWT